MASHHENFDSLPDRMSDRVEPFDMRSEATLSREGDAMEHEEMEEHRWEMNQHQYHQYLMYEKGRRIKDTRDISPNEGPGRSTIPTTSGWITTTPMQDRDMEDESPNQEQSTDYDDLPELVPCTPDTTTDESSDEDEEGDIEIHDVNPRRCCSSGARRMILYADTEFPTSHRNPVNPLLMVVDKEGIPSMERTARLLRQPANWQVNGSSIWLWIGEQSYRNIQEIEESGASIWVFLKRMFSEEISSRWRLKIDLCGRQKWPKQDCIYCCQESLQYIDGLTAGQAQSFAGGTSYKYEPNETEEAKIGAATKLCAAINGLDLSELESQEARFTRFVFRQIAKNAKD